MNKPQPLPCPKCGSKNVGPHLFHGANVVCYDCGHEGEADHFYDGSLDLWNDEQRNLEDGQC